MSSPPLELPLDPTEPDLRRSDVGNFENRLPDPTELIRWGGRPGVRYLMIDSRNLHEATQPDDKGERWVQCRDVPIYTITGPTGMTTIMVLSKGKPIEGADAANGIREWFYDRTILLTTGIKNPYTHMAETTNAQAQAVAPGKQVQSGPHPA